MDEYHYSYPYNDGLPSPQLRYENYEKGKGKIILPQPRDAPQNQEGRDNIIVNGLVTTQRVLKNYIEFMNLKYSSPDLIKLFRKLGKQKVTILYDMRDVRTIWVRDPTSNKPIKLNLTNGWANAFIVAYQDLPIPLSFWKREVSLIKETHRKKINLTIFRKERGLKYRSNLRRKAAKLGKRDRKRKESIRDNQRKMEMRRMNQKPPLNERAVVEIRENGEFVRKYVPLSKSLKSKVDRKKT